MNQDKSGLYLNPPNWINRIFYKHSENLHCLWISPKLVSETSVTRIPENINIPSQNFLLSVRINTFSISQVGLSFLLFSDNILTEMITCFLLYLNCGILLSCYVVLGSVDLTMESFLLCLWETISSRCYFHILWHFCHYISSFSILPVAILNRLIPDRLLSLHAFVFSWLDLSTRSMRTP